MNIANFINVCMYIYIYIYIYIQIFIAILYVTKMTENKNNSIS